MILGKVKSDRSGFHGLEVNVWHRFAARRSDWSVEKDSLTITCLRVGSV
jgi:hypothetical protein